MTIKDLAAKTGFAVGTVSRALNNHPNVNPSTRAAILEAAQELGFERNANAKQLKQQTSNTILVMVKGTRNELFAKMVEYIQSLLRDTDYQLVVDYLDEDLNEVQRAAQLCRTLKPLGVLFLGANTRNFPGDFEKITVPCVTVTNDSSTLTYENLSSVSTNDQEAARAAVEMLIGQGHRQFAVIGGDRLLSDTSRLRYQGCLQAFQAHGITFDPDKDYQGVRYSYEAGYKATKTLLETGREFTAIFAIADVMAIGAIRALHDSGLRVPEDVSVMGVDGLALGDYLVPQLATVCQSAWELTARGVQILLDNIQGEKTCVHEWIPFTILERESIRSISR